MTNRQTLSLLLFAVACVLACMMPTAYLIESPGRVAEVSGDGAQLLEVEGAPTYPSQTQLYMTTVASAGNASYGAFGIEVLAALAHPHWQILPVRALYPAEMTYEDQQERGTIQMESSQSAAEILALERAGYEVQMKLVVAGVPEESPAAGKLEEGDVIVGITAGDYHEDVTSYSRLLAVLSTVEPGSEVQVAYEREGARGEALIVTEANEEDATGWARPGSRLGIGVSVEDIESQASVGFNIEEVGGPSAGTMFALGIYDVVTEGSLGGEARIAGTGSLSISGEVGRIGGIEHKMRGAAGLGIHTFLSPATNCADTLGVVPEGMTVYAVHTFEEALSVVEAVGAGDTDSLLTCERLMDGLSPAN